MSITIEYKLPIIDGYVVVPGSETIKSVTVENVLTAIAGSTIGRLTKDTTGLTPQKVGRHEGAKNPQVFIVMPSFDKTTGKYPSDWFATLRALA